MITDLKYTPESRGISSKSILKLLKKADKKKIPLHSLLIAKGEDIILNAYWAPFKKDGLHRMNSITKSFVGLAIGLLIEEGKLSLDDKIIDFFPETKDYNVSDEVKAQTVYDLLTMRTSYVLVPGKHWVKFGLYDRIKSYFEAKPFKPAQTLFYYDSPGSYILCVIVERLSGSTLMDYLKNKLLRRIGFSEESDCIKDPMGYSWGDSGLLCKTEDLYRVGFLIKNGGMWFGKRLMSEGFLKAATSSLGSNRSEISGLHRNQGYGYQIWHESNGGFGFHGMGMQYMICIPEKDLYIVCTADTQGDEPSRSIFIDMLFDFIDEEVASKPLPKDCEGYKSLVEYCKELKLVALDGEEKSAASDRICGKRIALQDNPMGIKWMKLLLGKHEGSLEYENAQGVKCLRFGLLKNVVTEFPQDGYANLVIGGSPNGYRHPCAVSAAWQDSSTFAIRAQMIGNHLGGLYIRIGFDQNRVGVQMSKNTECFLNEYSGYAIGELEN